MGKSKRAKLKKYLILSTILIILVLSIFFFLKESNSFSIFDNSSSTKLFGKSSASQIPAETCNDGILNQDEEKVDCGGTICGPCPTCYDGIQNQGERHIDCGGPCEACPPDCYDGILNQDEEKVDCGGTICGPCPTCNDGIQNQGEGGIDCGGPCPIACPPTCHDRIQNQGEEGIDCGGPCSACVIAPVILTSLTPEEAAKVKNAILSSEFISAMPNNGVISIQFYYFPLGERIWLDTFLIGKNQILTSGNPDMNVIIHSKYISELPSSSLCDIIQKARTNGDFAYDTQLGDAKLLLKYSGMIKYRDCFGF